METATAGRDAGRRSLVAPFVIAAGSRSQATKRALGRLLKWIARGLYLSPGLFLAGLIVGSIDKGAGSLVTVAFVCLVVAFFAVLNFYVVAAVIAWKASRRGRARLRLPFTSSGDGALGSFDTSAEPLGEAQAAPAAMGSTARARGTIVAISPARAPKEPLVLDAWYADADPPGRATEVVAFAVCAAGKLPAVVICGSAPTIIAPPTRQSEPETRARFGGDVRRLIEKGPAVSEEVDVLELREGDEVEVCGTVMQVLDDVDCFEVEGVEMSLSKGDAARLGSPYRHASRQRGVVLEAETTLPLVVRLIKRAQIPFGDASARP